MALHIRTRSLTSTPTPTPTTRSPTTAPQASSALDIQRTQKSPIKILFLISITMSALSILVVVLLAFFGQSNGLLIPGPDSEHKYNSAVADFALTDTSRKDPWDGGDRKIMVSLFMPVPGSSCSSECERPYMPGFTAKIANEQFFGDKGKGVFEKVAYKTCCAAKQAVDASRIPVVVVNGQTDTSRLMYANLARYIAASNIAVALLDHPHDSSVTEFPDGAPTIFNSGATRLSSLSPLTSWNATVTNAIDIRTQDIEFLLSSLSSSTLLSSKFPNFKFTFALDTSRYGIAGHGLGGTVATSMGFSDPSHVRFSINMGGSAPSLDHDVHTPTYFLGRTDATRKDDINWPATWPHLVGPATEFDLADSRITDFSDLPIVVDLAGMKAEAGKQGAWPNHAVRCFVEGIVKKEVYGEGEQGRQLKNCVRIFGETGRMVPYLGTAGKAVASEDKDSGAASGRRVFGSGMGFW